MNFLMKNTNKIIIDTNILFSAILYEGKNEYILFQLADRGIISIIILDYVYIEAKSIFLKKNINPKLLDDFLDTFENIEFLKIEEPSQEELNLSKKLVTDKKDRPIFIFANRSITAQKNVYLVTGDKHLMTDEIKKKLDNRVRRTREINDNMDF